MINLTEKRLREQLDIQRGMASGSDPDYSKYKDDFAYGDTVAIEWCGELEGEVDYGYVMGLPGIEEGDANMGGIIHIPYPMNPGGKDRPDAEWVTLYELGVNPIVRSVRKVADWKREAWKLKVNGAHHRGIE